MTDRTLKKHTHPEPEKHAWTLTSGEASCSCRTWTVAVYSALGRCQFCNNRLVLDITTVEGFTDA